MTTIEIRLFGAFRDLWPESSCRVEITQRATVAEVKNSLRGLLESVSPRDGRIGDLISRSALATAARVLTDADEVSGKEFAILPPVCGG